ncbi:MAG TPA: winged helix DNA-binding domain-containing protein [Candidatus Limnocylindria bacterium]|nr:winged helix DNA-binding domain-containing protein [Candidatus Limnocylindria bacterium]
MPPPVLTLRDLNRATLARQGLIVPLPAMSVARRIERLGSLQAQHPDWPPFALATRLPPGQTADLYAARVRRSVVRATLMRLTVHVVSAADFWPMSTLTLEFRRNQFRALYKQDPVTSPIGRQMASTLPAVRAAMRERPLAIREIEAIMAAGLQGVDIPPRRSLWRFVSGALPLVLVPFRKEAYGRARYVEAEEWIGPPSAEQADRQRAEELFAERYLAAFGPAGPDDIAAYLDRGRAGRRWREVVDRLGDRVRHFVDENGRPLVDLVRAPRPGGETPAPPRLLARWDSLLLAYGTADRTRVLPDQYRSAVITNNADVLPTFLVDGFVAGTWLPRLAAGGNPDIELRPFGRLPASVRSALEDEAQRVLPTLRAGAFSRYPGTD